MAKLILLSIVLFTTLLPIAWSKREPPARTLRTIQILTVAAAILWAYGCRSCYPQYVFIQ